MTAAWQGAARARTPAEREAAADRVRMVNEVVLFARRWPEFDASLASGGGAFGDEFVRLLLGRFETAGGRPVTPHGEDDHAMLKLTLHWCYASQPRNRPAIRQWIGNTLAQFAKYPNKRLAVAPILDVTAQIVRGFGVQVEEGRRGAEGGKEGDAGSGGVAATSSSSSCTVLPPLDSTHRQLLLAVILPLHRPNTFFEWRDQLPLLQTYHSSLVYCVLQFLERESALLDAVVGALSKPGPRRSTQTRPKR